MDNKFENELRDMNKPMPEPSRARRYGRQSWLSARQSAGWGILLLIVPVLFFVAVAVKYYLGLHWELADGLTDFIAKLDREAGTRWVSPILFVILPALILIANLAAIISFTYDRLRKQLILAIDIRWLNLLLALASLIVMAVVFLYGIMENAHHRAVEQYGL